MGVSRKKSNIIRSTAFGRRFSDATKHLKRSTLAQILGVSGEAIRTYKKGALPNGAIMLQIKEVLGISIDWLLTGEEEKGEVLTADEAALVVAIREVPEIIPSLIRLIYSIIETREAAVRRRPHYSTTASRGKMLKVAELQLGYGEVPDESED